MDNSSQTSFIDGMERPAHPRVTLPHPAIKKDLSLPEMTSPSPDPYGYPSGQRKKRFRIRAPNAEEAREVQEERKSVEDMDEATLYEEAEWYHINMSGSLDEVRDRLLRCIITHEISYDLAVWDEEQDERPVHYSLPLGTRNNSPPQSHEPSQIHEDPNTPCVPRNPVHQEMLEKPLRNHIGAAGAEMLNHPQVTGYEMDTCRLCMSSDEDTRALLFEDEVKVKRLTGITILPDEGLPMRVCRVCADRLNAAFEFKRQVIISDSILRARWGIRNYKETDKQTNVDSTASTTRMQQNCQASAAVSAIQEVEEPLPTEVVPPTLPQPQQRPRSPHRALSKRQRLSEPPSGSFPYNQNQKTLASSTPSGTGSPSLGSLHSRNPFPRVRPQKVRHSPTPTIVLGMQLRGDGACWRCGIQGHTHRQCRAPKQWEYCYLCGERHVRVSTCPQCSASWWKGHQEPRLGNFPNTTLLRGREGSPYERQQYHEPYRQTNCRPYGQTNCRPYEQTNCRPYEQTNCRPYEQTNHGLYGQTNHVT